MTYNIRIRIRFESPDPDRRLGGFGFGESIKDYPVEAKSFEDAFREAQKLLPKFGSTLDDPDETVTSSEIVAIVYKDFLK